MNRAAASAGAAWPRPVANAAATFEFAAPWLAVLLAGAGALLALVLAFQSEQAQALHDARVHITVHEIAARLEADLALGYELQESPRAQRLLEDALAHDSGLLGAEVFDTRGVSLFNTDRGSIGEQVPQVWLDVARPHVAKRDNEERPWAVNLAGDRTLGLPVNDVLGQPAAHVAVTTVRVPPPRPAAILAGGAIAALLLLLAGALVANLVLRSEIGAADADAMDAAAQRLAAAQARLDELLEKLTQEEEGPAR